jgi:hypothetical protein
MSQPAEQRLLPDACEQHQRGGPIADALPPVVDAETWQRELADVFGGNFLGSFKVTGRPVFGGAAGLACIRSMKERVMPVPSRRLAAAGVIAAALIALPAAAFASGSTSSGKPGPSATASNSAQASKSPAAGTSPLPNSSAAAMKNAARQSRALESGTMPSMVAALATQLGVSHSAAQRAMNQLDAVSDRNGVDPASAAFAAIAHELGVTPARLAAALDAAKQAARQSVGGN